MVMRTIANKVGTIEVDGNSFYFLQPLSTFKTDEMELIQQAYEKEMTRLKENPSYLVAKDIAFQSGQVQFEFDLTGLQSFDALKSMIFEDKLAYYLSLLQIAKNPATKVLWQKENFVLNAQDQQVHALVIENTMLELRNSKEPLDAVKELIIVSLTNLNRVLGRPRRADFFEQREDVIRFAETIYLRLNSIQEIEEYVCQVKESAEETRRLEEEAIRLQQASQKKLLFFNHETTKKLQRLFKVPDPSPKSKKKKVQPVTGKEGNGRFLMGVGGILIGALTLNILLTSVNESAQANEAGEPEVPTEVDITEVYRQGVLGNESLVIEALENKEYNSLAPADQEVLNYLYVASEEYPKAIQNDPDLLEDVVNRLVQEGNVEGLEELTEVLDEPDPLLQFELAALQSDWTSVLKLRNEIEMTESRGEKVTQAFIALGDLQEAKKFVTEHFPENEELMNHVLEVEKIQNELDALRKEQAEKQNLMDTNTDKEKVNQAKKRLEEIDQHIQRLDEELQQKGG